MKKANHTPPKKTRRRRRTSKLTPAKFLSLQASKKPAPQKRNNERLKRSVGGTRTLIDFNAHSKSSLTAPGADESNFRTLVETIPAAIFIVQGSNPVYVNAAAESITEYLREELLERDFWSFVHPDFRELVKQRALAHQRGENLPAQLEVLIITKSGRERWLEIVSGRILYQGSAAVLTTAFDVTDRKKTEALLRESEGKYRLLFVSNPEAMWVYDVETLNFLAVNRTAVVRYGYTEKQFLSMTIDAIGTREELKKDEVDIRRPTQSSGQFKGVVHRRRDGTFMDVEILAHPITFEGKSASLVIAKDVTERLDADEALRRSEEKYRDIVSSSPIGIYQVTVEGMFITANNALALMLGYDSANELLRLNLGEDIYRNKDDRNRLLRKYDPSGESAQEEVQWRKKDGSPIWVQLNAHSVKSTHGKTLCVEGFVYDVTERKEAERIIRESEERFRTVWEHSVEGMRLTDDEGRIVMVNEAYCGLVRLSRAQLVGKLLPVVYRPQTQNEDLEIYRERFAKETVPPRVTSGITLWNGEILHVEISNSFVRLSESRRLLLSIFRDVTVETRSEEALRQSEERYRSLIESARDAIYTLAPDGTVTSLNSAFETITGWKKDEWLGKSFTGLVHPADLPTARRMFQSAMEGRQAPVSELRIVTKPGHFLVGEITTTPQRSGGSVVGSLGIVRDMTERKQLEEQLRQSQKLESIGTLAGGIAHDFNNILAIMLGYVSLLQRGNVAPDRYKKSINALASAIQRGAALVRQLLTFARKSEISFQLLNVNELLEELVKMLEATFPKTVEFLVTPDEDLPLVSADQSQLHQVLLNLCVNARDAMPIGGTLSITTETVERGLLGKKFAEAGGHDYIAISIKDTGLGMNEATRTRIFEPFFTTKEQGKGTGLGLAVAYGVVKSHNGFIDVESEVGHGTTFRIYLPSAQTRDSAELEYTEAGEGIKGGKETILFAEDEESLSGLVKQYLEESGYKVFMARDGIEAVEMYKENKGHVDLVLSDLGLPKQGGWEAVMQMREMNPRLNVIVLSGYVSPEQRMEMTRLGVQDIIQKPYAPTDVLKKIRKVLDTRITTVNS